MSPAQRRQRTEARLRDLRRRFDGELGDIFQELESIERDESAAGGFMLDRDELESCERCGVDWRHCRCDPTAGAGS